MTTRRMSDEELRQALRARRLYAITEEMIEEAALGLYAVVVNTDDPLGVELRQRSVVNGLIDTYDQENES